jgi:hypothetical protein
MKSMIETKDNAAPKLRARGFGSAAGKGTDLKGKRPSSPRLIVLTSIVNINGVIVILHRLRPVLINR